MENFKTPEYNKKIRVKPNIVNSPLYENISYLRNSIFSEKSYNTTSLQNISIAFIAKQNSSKNNSKKFLTEYSITSDSKSINSNNHQISSHIPRKNDSFPRKTQKIEQKNSPYKRKITKFIKNFRNYKSPKLVFDSPKEILRNNQFHTTTISHYIQNLNNYDNVIDLKKYGKDKKEYLLFDNYYLDNSRNENNLYNKYSKNNTHIHKTHSCSSIKKSNSNIKILCDSFNIVDKNNNNDYSKKNNKLIKQLKLYDKKLNEFILQNKKINELNTILIRDNKLLISKTKNDYNKYNNGLSVQKQLNLIYENYNYNNMNKNIAKAKLFLILQEKFISKKLNDKFLLFKYFNILNLYSKLNNNNKEKTFAVIQNENLFVKKEKDINNNNINYKNKLLKFIINRINLQKTIFVKSFENWKYKSKILETINFVKEKKKKKKEKSKQRKKRKKHAVNQNQVNNKDNTNTINNINYINNINCYDDKKEEELWGEYGSEYSDEGKNVEDEEMTQNFVKSKSYKKNYCARQNINFNHNEH